MNETGDSHDTVAQLLQVVSILLHSLWPVMSEISRTNERPDPNCLQDGYNYAKGTFHIRERNTLRTGGNRLGSRQGARKPI
jgi:hypothetical protein